MRILKCGGDNPSYLIFIMGFIVLIIGNIIVANELNKRRIAADLVSHTYQVINKIDSFSLNFIEAERQFQLSIYNKKHYSVFPALMMNMQENLSEIKKLTLDNAYQQTRIAKAELLIKQSLNLFQRISNKLEADKLPTVLINLDEVIIAIKTLTNAMRLQEFSLLKQRSKTLSYQRVLNYITIISTNIIGYLLLMFAFIAIIRLKKRMEKDHLQIQQLEHEKCLIQENQRIELEFSLNAFKLGYWNLNLETHVAHRSLLHDQIFGYRTLLPEWTYEKFLSHVHPDDCARVDQAFNSASINDHSWEFECRIYRADDSSLRWIWAIGKTLIVNQRKHMFGLVQDITERKNTELALQSTMNKMNALLEATPDCLIISNKEGQIIFVNRVTEQVFGYTTTEIVGQKIEFLLPPRYQAQHVKNRQHYFDSPKLRPMGQGLELFGQHKDGHEFPVEISLSPIETEEGTLVLSTHRDITERKQNELSLLKYAAIIESNDDAIISKNLEGVITSWNGGAERMFGYPRDEAMGQPILMLFPEEYQYEEILMLEKVCSGEKVDHYETICRHRDGKLIDISVTLSPILDLKGVIIGTSIVGRDITKQKQSENALKVSELRFRTMADAMPQVVWITQPDGWNIYFNQQWVDYTGLTLEESYGHGWNKPFHPHDKQRAWDAWQQAIHNTGKYSLECRLRRKDGNYRWWLVRGVPLRDESGKIIQWFGTCTDINDLKQAENALKESEERFRKAFETATNGMALVSLEGKFIKVNESLCTMLGYGNVELLAKDLQTIIHPEELAASLNSLHQLVVRKIESFRGENRFTHKKGNLIWVFLGVSLIRTKEGAPIHFVFQIQDITQSKLTEQELRIAAATFETYEAIMITDMDGSIVKVNKAFTRITGYSPEDVLGKNPRIMQSGRHDKSFYGEMFHKLQSDGAWEGEIWDKRKNDEIYPLWMVITAIKDAQQKVILYVSMFNDISERKKREDDKAMLLALVESSDEAIIGKDLQGIIFSWNKSAEILYGYKETEMIGYSIKKLFPEEKQDEFDLITQMIKQGGHIKHKETVRIHKDGHRIPVSVTISPIINAQGEVVGASTTARDITQQKLLEQKLKHLAEHDWLTGLVNRTIFEDRLIQAVAQTKRQKLIMAVCYIDIDGFKAINDLYGHAVGDKLLCAVTTSMQESIREIDTLARLGGDEFALILVNIDKEQDVIRVVKKLLSGFSKGFLIENKNLMVTGSIGISLFPKDGESSLIEKADAAMYYVKKHGKNDYKFYDNSIAMHT